MSMHTCTDRYTHMYACMCGVFIHTYTFSLDCVRVTAGSAKPGRKAREENSRSWLVAFLKPEVIILFCLAPPFNLSLAIS